MRSLATSLLLAASALAVTSAIFGCASPGPPRAPSLYLPAAVKNLTAERIGPAVALHFTVPQRTTDDLPLKTPALGLRVCREVEHSSCTPLPQLPNSVSTKDSHGSPNVVNLTDTLPAELAAGSPRLLAYRVELVNQRGRSGPRSEATYALAGQAPPPVTGLTATGTRLGILLSWSPATEDGSELLLQRDLVAPTAKPSTLLFRASETPATPPKNTLDTSAEEAVSYRYAAYRETHVTLGGRTLRFRSESTPPVAFTLHDTFPPPTPTDLTAAAFTTDTAYSIDLIWQPVEDPGLVGYLVYRETIAPATSPRTRLTATPLPTPAFHDATVISGTHYRYSVSAIDRNGNESPTATAIPSE